MAQDRVRYKVVIIGGSAGSLDVILKVIPGLPVDSGAFFILVVHRKNDADSILAQLLSGRTALPVREVEDKEPVVTDTIFIAPPDYHLLLENEDSFSLDTSEKVHHSRPSIDISFESVAETFGANAIGILLSGANADGAAGLQMIAGSGGHTIVQDPATADVSYMPQQALLLGSPNAVLAPEEMAEYLKKLLLD